MSPGLWHIKGMAKSMICYYLKILTYKINMDLQMILKLSQSVCYSTAATIFWQKNFQRKHIIHVIYFAGNGVMMELYGTRMLPITIPLTVVLYSRTNASDIGFKAGLFCSSFLAISDIRFSLVEKSINFISGSDSWWKFIVSDRWKLWRISLAAAVQFIRKPEHLKIKLQNVRSKLGPIFVFSVAHFASGIINGPHHTITGLPELAIGAVATAILGGVFFRPDNSTVLDVIGFDHIGATRRKFLHRNSMILSISGVAAVAALCWLF